MLYKVTPMMPSPDAEKVKKARAPGQPRKKRKTAIYDAEGNEVLITLMCLKCKSMKPLANFGLRKMADGAIRNQPWCRTCRGGAGTKKKTPQGEVIAAVPSELAEAHAEPVSSEVELAVTAEVSAPVVEVAAAPMAPEGVLAEMAVDPAAEDASPLVVSEAAPEPVAMTDAPAALSDEEPTLPGESAPVQPA